MDLTSAVNLRASNIGSIFKRALSDGSANHDFIGMALSRHKYNILVKDFHDKDTNLE